MPTRNINLTPELDQYVDQRILSSLYEGDVFFEMRTAPGKRPRMRR